jgi:hypothetical protein
MCHASPVRTLLSIAVIAALVPACKASVNVEAKTGPDEPQEQEGPSQAASQEKTVKEAASATDYFGVARGLSLKPGQPAACSCVAAAVGYPGNDEFKWRGVPPKVADDGLVVAIGTDGIQCDKQGPGPSIHAIDRSGDDVIVVLEDWQQARPQALGAIIPNPGGNGHVYLRAHGKGGIYGNPLGAGEGPHKNLCRIGQGKGTANVTVAPSNDEVQNAHD